MILAAGIFDAKYLSLNATMTKLTVNQFFQLRDLVIIPPTATIAAVAREGRGYGECVGVVLPQKWSSQ